MMVNLRDDFSKAWKGQDPFKKVSELSGDVYRDVKGRRTLRFEFAQQRYFAKIHAGVGWGEIVKNLLTLKMPVLGAENEWCAIAKLRSLGLATMTAVGFGSRGGNPATRQSFILTEALENTISLEDYCGNWLQQKPSYRIKLSLITELARISKILHQNGVCHRDYYLCHFLLHEEEAFNAGQIDTPQLSVIDLHRALIRRKLPTRWVIKDVAGLYFSALQIGLNRHDFLRFVRLYTGKSLRTSFSQDAQFWQQVQDRAMQLDKKTNSA
jgi:heptose I phosphotransferase